MTRNSANAKAKSPASPARKRSVRRTKPFVAANRPFTRQSEAYDHDGCGLGWHPCSADTPPEAFGLKIVGNCLAPRASDGQIVIVESRLPEPGDLAVFWFKSVAMPLVKILCKPIFGYPLHPESECIPIIEVEQLNPPKRYSIGLDKIECIARVHSVVTAETVLVPSLSPREKRL